MQLQVVVKTAAVGSSKTNVMTSIPTSGPRREARTFVLIGWLNVEFIFKVNLHCFSIRHRYHPDTVDVLWVVLRIVR